VLFYQLLRIPNGRLVSISLYSKYYLVEATLKVKITIQHLQISTADFSNA